MSLEYGLREKGTFARDLDYEGVNQSGMYFAELSVSFLKSGATFRKGIKLIFTGTIRPEE
jgi:hypothetical protein